MRGVLRVSVRCYTHEVGRDAMCVEAFVNNLDSIYIFVGMIVLVCTCVTVRENVRHSLALTLSYHFIQRAAMFSVGGCRLGDRKV